MLVVAAAVVGASPAKAAEVTRVVSALDDENRFDFNATLAWLHQSESSFIKREDPQFGLVKDLEYARRRDVLDMRLDFGVLWDVGIHVGVPLVLADERSLDF